MAGSTAGDALDEDEEDGQQRPIPSIGLPLSVLTVAVYSELYRIIIGYYDKH